MQDFDFCIPTKFIMGKRGYASVGNELRQRGAKRVLVLHSGGSHNAQVLEAVRSSIAECGISAVELGEPVKAPKLSLALRGVEFCRSNKVDFILAIGGGTVMDTGKVIAFLSCNDGDLTDYVLYRKFSPKCLPVAGIVTLSGTGSEVSATAMIIDDRAEPEIKYPLFQESMRFAFSIMDPTLLMTLPMTQVISGAFDSVTHIMEHYFCGADAYELQDRMCEAVMTSIMSSMSNAVKDPMDYDTRAQLQMGATLANSTLLGLGCGSDWAVHYMENPITTKTHQPHGSTLAIIAPAWMRYCFKRDIRKAVHFATRVMGVEWHTSDEETAVAGIDALEHFLREIGLPTRLNDIGIGEESFALFAQRAEETAGQPFIGGVSKLTRDEVVEIYRLAK